jgi:DNA-binding MarR family transcriptional regulator
MHAAELMSTLKRLHEAIEADLQQAWHEAGLDDYKPRYQPVIDVLRAQQPCSIKRIAQALGATHSAISQTVAEMERRELVQRVADKGTDGRERRVALTRKAALLLRRLDIYAAATQAAVAALDQELPRPLGKLATEALQALQKKPLRQRIAHAQRTLRRPA